jgi:hypothetical protein
VDQEFAQIETEEQAVFRAGRSTIDHIFCLKQLIEKKMAVDQPLHLLFVDLEKTYDSVPLQSLWKALEHCNISSNIIRAIKRLYEKSFSKIKILAHPQEALFKLHLLYFVRVISVGCATLQ